MNQQSKLIAPHATHKIFVSYSRDDRNAVLKEVDCIRNLGCRVFVDDQINPGDCWIDRLADEIIGCDIFLVFLTENSINSRYVLDEIKYAARINKKIIPISFYSILLSPAIELLIGAIQRLEKNKFTQDGYEEKLRYAIWGGGQSSGFANNNSLGRSGGTVANFSEHDKKLLAQMGQLFSFDVIRTIREDRFGKFVGDNVIRPVNEFIERSEDPLCRFKSDALEAMRLDALNKANEFIWHFAQQSAGAVGGYDYIEIPYGRADESYFRDYSIKTSKLAINFCNAISKLRAELINC